VNLSVVNVLCVFQNLNLFSVVQVLYAMWHWILLYYFFGSASWKEKEKVCEEIVACPFGGSKKFIVSEPKKKALRKLKWEINRVYQYRCVARLFGLNLFGGDEDDEVQDLLQDWGER
jgi:hypothetical protein